MNGKTLVWITLAALVSAGCKEKDGGADGGAMLEYSPAVNEVDVIRLERQPFPMQILSNGKLSPASSSSLSFPSGGTIVRVNFENGDRVEKGDVIAELDSGEQKLALDAAEIALEHQLGLTCDPIGGYVQIPCIERNAVAAMRALDSADLAHVLSGTRKISFDLIVRTMYETGRDLNARYRETSEGGLAAGYKRC